MKFRNAAKILTIILFLCAALLSLFASCSPEPQETESVAHLVVLAGQSNCEGVAKIDALESKIDADRFERLKNGFDNVRFIRPSSGSHIDNFIKCRLGFGTTLEHFGIEAGIAEYLSETFPEENFYLVKKAHGGTSIDYWWGGEKPWDSDVNYYTGLVNDVKNAVSVLESEGKKVVVEALCWMQGESDSHRFSNADSYGEKLRAMVGAFRSEFKDYNTSAIRFIDGAINDEGTTLPYFGTVNFYKKQFAEQNENNVYIDTIAMGLTKHGDPESDLMHYDSLSMLRLGIEFGKNVMP